MRLPLLSFALALALHLVVFALAVIGFSRQVPTLELPEAVPIEVVTIADTSNVKAVAPEEPEPQAEPEPEQATPTPETAPESEPVPEEAPDVTEEAPAEDPPKEEPKPEPPKEEPKPKQEDEEFNLDKIGILIDKAKEEKGEASEKPPSETASEQGEKPREAVGDGTLMTMDIVASFRRQISRCYSPPAGADRAEELIVQIDIALRPDGTLAEPPKVVDESRMNEPYFRAAAEAGIRAIHQCAPYDLPADRYEQWKLLRLNFDPRKMLGL